MSECSQRVDGPQEVPKRSGALLPRVVYFHRLRRRSANFSIERIFEDVRARLAGRIVPVVSVGRFESSGLIRRTWLCLEAWLRQGDVNHVTGDINFVGLLLTPRRTVQTIHDCGHLARTSGLRHALLKLFWVTIPIRRCAAVTVVSEATKQELLRYVPWCPAEKIVVIPNAIQSGFEFDARPFDSSCPRILQIGTAPNKNLPRLVGALRGLRCHLEVVGRLSDSQRLLLEEAGIDYSAKADLTDAEVIEAYRRADLVAFVSTYEGFGMPILEAQATGRPVITSNVLSMPFVAGDGALLVDPGDSRSIREAVERLIRDPGLRARLIKAGRENVKRFSAAAVADQYLDLYLRVLRRMAP